MQARACLLLLPAAFGWVGADEPKARPRLMPPVVSEVRRETAPTGLEHGSAPSFRSFDEFLQAEARRPPGLSRVRAAAATRAEAADAVNSSATSGPPVSPEPGGAGILVLPKMEVSADRLAQLKTGLATLGANQSWEESSAATWEHRTVVDAILNPAFLKLGGYSGSGRAATARRRAELLNWVRILSISREEAKTPAEKSRIQADIDGITSIMRLWD